MHVKKGDVVQIIAGKDKPQSDEDKGKPSGKVLKVFQGTSRVIVEGKNFVWKHLRKQQEMQKGGRIQVEAPIHVSNVMIFCQKCSKAVRTKKASDSEGKKIRVCNKCGTAIDK